MFIARLTLAGRKFDMTSLTFWVGGPAGGGGGPGVAEPVTMMCYDTMKGAVWAATLGKGSRALYASSVELQVASRRWPDAQSFEMLSRGRAQIVAVDPGAWQLCITAPTSAIGNLRIIHAESTFCKYYSQLTYIGPRQRTSLAIPLFALCSYSRSLLDCHTS